MSSGILGGLIAAALVGWLTWLANRRKVGATTTTTAHYGLAYKIVSLLMAILGASLFALSVFAGVTGNPTATWWVFVVLGGMAAGAIACCCDAFTRGVKWDEVSIRFRKWNGERTASWDEVTGIDVKPMLQYRRVDFRDGGGFAIPDMMTGGNNFVEEALLRGAPLTQWGRPLRP